MPAPSPSLATLLFDRGAALFDAAFLALALHRVVFNALEDPDPFRQTDSNRWNWWYYVATPSTILVYVAALALFARDRLARQDSEKEREQRRGRRITVRALAASFSFVTTIVLVFDLFVTYPGNFPREEIAASIALNAAAGLCNVGALFLA